MTLSSASPHSTDTINTDTPLTVLFSFLSRADATVLDQRSRADGHLLGQDGKPIANPASDPSANAFEPDPNLNFEHWGDYWRRIHGVRFITPDNASDQQIIDLLLRYDQIHRFTPGPTSLNPLPYTPPLDANGQLFDTIIGHVEPYRRPDWDGIAYLSFENIEALGAMLGSERVHSKILPEDRTLFRDLAPILARQFVLIPNSAADDSVILVKTHVKRADLDRSFFQRLWLHDHADFVLSQPETRSTVKRYVQLHNVRTDDQNSPFFHPATSHIDGVTVMAFGSMALLERYLSSDNYAAIEQAEREIMDVDAGEYWTGVNMTIVDRCGAERMTARP